MSGNHTTSRGGFEEALQSSIEASLRTNGAAPSLRIFSLLYHRSKPQGSNLETAAQLEYYQDNVAARDNNGDVLGWMDRFSYSVLNAWK